MAVRSAAVSWAWRWICCWRAPTSSSNCLCIRSGEVSGGVESLPPLLSAAARASRNAVRRASRSRGTRSD
eukprot:3822006-Rhodomonas_salina.1